MMVIMEAFPQGSKDHQVIFSGVDVAIIWPIAIHVRCAVHQPGGIEGYCVAENSQQEAAEKGFSPAVPRNKGRKQEAQEHHRCLVMPPLEHHNSVSFQVRQVQLLSFSDDIRVFAHQQPANMSKEKAPFCIMGICIRLREFVVCTVVSGPLINIILESHGVDYGQEYSERQGSFVRPVTPKPMCSSCNSKTTQDEAQNSPHQSEWLCRRYEGDGIHCSYMEKSHQDNVPPDVYCRRLRTLLLTICLIKNVICHLSP